MNSTFIRPANEGDSTAIAMLSESLGYARNVDETATLLRQLGDPQRHCVWVAECEGAVVGWIEALAFETLTADPEALIVGLVVDDRHRGRGIGARLVAEVEGWAQGMRLSAVRVRSQEKRTDAHRFYSGLGYEVVKTQLVFRKPLASGH